MDNIYMQTIRVILVLAAIVAAMFFMYRYAGKFKFNVMRQKETPYGLKKIDMIHLGYKKFVSVVEVKNHVLVIGVGEKDLSLLTQWTKEKEEGGDQ
jgi:flagellar biogenesis protein FliO